MKRLTLVETNIVAGGCAGTIDFSLNSSTWLNLPVKRGKYLIANVTFTAQVSSDPQLQVTCGTESTPHCFISPGKNKECACPSSGMPIELAYLSNDSGSSCKGLYGWGCQ